jgi:hypothetical protein
MRRTKACAQIGAEEGGVQCRFAIIADWVAITAVVLTFSKIWSLRSCIGLMLEIEDCLARIDLLVLKAETRHQSGSKDWIHIINAYRWPEILAH